MSSSCGLMPEPDRQRALRVEVDEQHLAADLGQRGAEVDRGGRLADAALLVAHRDDPGRPVRGRAAAGPGTSASAGRSGRAPVPARARPRPRRRPATAEPVGRPRPCSSGWSGRLGADSAVGRLRAVTGGRLQVRRPVRASGARDPSRGADAALQGTSAGRSGLSKRSRVGGGVHLAQPVGGDQRVQLGGGHRRVAEQLLDHPDVGAAVQQVGGEGVPQGVRADVPRRGPPARRPPAARSRRSAGTAARRASSGTAPAVPGRAPSRGREPGPGPHQVGRARRPGRTSPSGTTRSLRPLPNSRTEPCSRSRSSTSSPTASLIRAPQP